MKMNPSIPPIASIRKGPLTTAPPGLATLAMGGRARGLAEPAKGCGITKEPCSGASKQTEHVPGDG